MERISKITSWVFLPLLTPLYGVMLIMFVPSHQVNFILEPDSLYLMSTAKKLSLLYHFFFFGTILPAGLMIFLRSRGMISTIEIDDRKERGLPIIIMGISCLTLFLYLFFMIPDQTRAPKFLFSYPLSGVLSVAIFYVMTKWKKVSLHAGGVGIMTGFLIAYFAVHQEHAVWILPVAVLVSGLTMSARVYLQKHTMMEVIIGWFTGTFVTFMVNYFY